jgi:hypothetical protein
MAIVSREVAHHPAGRLQATDLFASSAPLSASTLRYTAETPGGWASGGSVTLQGRTEGAGRWVDIATLTADVDTEATAAILGYSRLRLVTTVATTSVPNLLSFRATLETSCCGSEST